MRMITLRTKILGLLFGTILVLGLALVGLVQPLLKQKLRLELEDKGRFMVGHLASMSVDYLLTEQYLPLQIMLRDFPLEDQDTVYVFVEDRNDQVIAHTFKNGFPVDLKDINLLPKGHKSSSTHLNLGGTPVLDFAMHIMDGKLGHVHIGLSETSIAKSTTRIIWVILATIGAVLFIGTLIASLFARKLTAPLGELVRVTKAVGCGDLSQRVTLLSKDELGLLSSALNQMIDDLQQTTVSKDDYRKQTEFLHEVVEGIPYPFCVINLADHSIALANSATGISATQEQVRCYQLSHKRDTPCWQDGNCDCPMEQVKQSRRPVVVEHVHFDQHNRQKHFEVHGYPIFDTDQELVQMIEFSIDITERKRAEQALQQSQQSLQQKNLEIDNHRHKLQQALDEISTSIQAVVQQQNLQIRYDNPTLTKCYEIKDCEKTDCPCFDGETAERCWQIAGTFCGGELQGELGQKITDCQECDVFQKATTDSVHRVGEYFNNMMHIVGLKNQELERAYQDLKSTHSQLLQQEKMASIGQLAAGVAHEINNPMGFITSNLVTLAKYEDKLSNFFAALQQTLQGLPLSPEALQVLQQHRDANKIDFILEDIKDLVDESLDGTSRVTEIVKNLKSFARLDEQVQMPADINECLESTLKIIWNELKYKAEVEKDYGELPPTKCLPMELNQVFMNILVNAAHAIEEQGVISIKTWNDPDKIYIAISDTGCGMPEDIVGKIFEPFFTTKEVGKGTGLGMSIAYDIVKKHAGEIEVDSSLGEGTTFTLELPIVA